MRISRVSQCFTVMPAWEAVSTGTPVDGSAYPAISYVDNDPTHAQINKWTWGDVTLTAKYDVLRFDAALNAQGGTFDDGYTGDAANNITASYPEGDAPYSELTLSIPYGTKITGETLLPEPTRPGYGFAGWVDGEGTPIGWTLDEEGNRQDASYEFDSASNTMWIATWIGSTFKIEYRLGEGEAAPENASIDSGPFESAHGYGAYAFSPDMRRADNSSVSAFELPTEDEIAFIDKTYSFEGWYTDSAFTSISGVRTFDPAEVAARLANEDADTLILYAKWTRGVIPFKEKFWLEVLDTADLDPGSYVSHNGHRYICDESLTLNRAGEAKDTVSTQGVAPQGYVFDSDMSHYPDGYSASVYLESADKAYVVNGFYNLMRTLMKIDGSQKDVEDTHVAVKSGDTPVWDTEKDGWLNASGDPWEEGDGDRFVPAPYGTDVTLGCTPDAGYEFVSWVTDGATPPDLDVFANPAAFKAPSYGVDVRPFVRLAAYKAFYRDDTGSELADIAQAVYTVKDEFALANLGEGVRPGYTFDKWVAAMADENGHAASGPVPSTVGYDADGKYMWVRTGTTGDLVFTATYVAKRYAVTIDVPEEARRDADGFPVGLVRDPRLEWSVDPETGDVAFTYTPGTVGATDDPITVDLNAIDAHPYRIDGWTATPDPGNDEGNPPTLDGGVIKIAPGTTGSANVKPTDVVPKAFKVVIDPMPDGLKLPEGYIVDEERFGQDVKDLIDEINSLPEDPDNPSHSKPVITDNGDGTWTIEFDAESEPQITLPKPVLVPTDADNPDTPEGKYEFIGWADNADGTNPTLEYRVPASDLSGFEEDEPKSLKPVWAKEGDDVSKTSITVHLPDNARKYYAYDGSEGAANEWTFRFTGTPLSETKAAYEADAAFNAKLTPADGYHLGYHIEWYGEFDEAANAPTGDRLSALPTNFPETGAIHIWGVWAQDDDIRPVGFNNVSFGTSGPPGYKTGRISYAINDDAGVFKATDEGLATPARIAYASVTYYYKASIGLVVKDEINDTFVKVKYIDKSIMDKVEQYLNAGWLFDGYYLEGDADKEIIIDGETGEVHQELLRQKTESQEIDLMFSDSWTRKQLVKIDFVGGVGDKAITDATLYWWPDLDVFIAPGNVPDPDADDRKSALATIDDVQFTVVELNNQGLATPLPRTNEDGTVDQFLGYFGRDHLNAWPKDESGNPIASARVGSLNAIGVTATHLDTYAYAEGAEVRMPYGYDANDPYDPKASGFYEIKWEAKWAGDLDAVYFNATVPMTMSFVVKSDGTTVGPDPGAYRVVNYSNTAIAVDAMSFEWADESELEKLFGAGGADALVLSAAPTGQGFANGVSLVRAEATQDATDLPKTNKHTFEGEDKWTIKESVGIKPEDFAGDIADLPTLKLDYRLTTGGISQIATSNDQDTSTHPIGTLKFTLRTLN